MAAATATTAAPTTTTNDTKTLTTGATSVEAIHGAFLTTDGLVDADLGSADHPLRVCHYIDSTTKTWWVATCGESNQIETIKMKFTDGSNRECIASLGVRSLLVGKSIVLVETVTEESQPRIARVLSKAKRVKHALE